MGRQNYNARRSKRINQAENICEPLKPVPAPKPKTEPREPKIIAFEDVSQGGGYRKTWIERKGAG